MVGNHHTDRAVVSAEGFVNHNVRRATMPATQPRNLQGQKALVTGATSGIGRAVALQLARDGAEVIVHGRDAARGAETVESITAAGGRARFVGADLSDPADLQRLVEAVGDICAASPSNAGIPARPRHRSRGRSIAGGAR